MNTIDIHHHFIGPDFEEAWGKLPISARVKLPLWSPERSLAFMDRHDIRHAVLSPALPPSFVSASADAATQLARRMNIYIAGICAGHPTRFSFFAALPNPRDSEACIRELAYACDKLGAVGASLFTSYDGSYLGDPSFRVLWAELDRRAAVVFVHPGMDFDDQLITSPSLIARPVVDWTHETTRAATHLILSGSLDSHPHCRIILPHGGGTLPYVVRRLSSLATALGMTTLSADDILAQAKSFYYDVAFAAYPEPLQLLRLFAAPGHLLYGSDFPFARDEEIYKEQMQNLRHIGATELLKDFWHAAALRLFPQLADEEFGVS